MSGIQEKRALELCITDIADDYVKKFYNEDDVLAIGRHCEKITLKADSREAIKMCKTTEIYPLKELVRKDDDGKMEPDCEFQKLSTVFID